MSSNPKISTEEIAEKLNVDRSTAFRHLKKLGYTLKLDIWVPHILTELNKLKFVSTAVSLLARQQNEPFLDRVITGDEKWIMYHNINRKRSWKYGSEQAESLAKAELHPMKIFLCV